MPVQPNELDLPLIAASETGAQRFFDALASYLGTRKTTPLILTELRENDPECRMASVLQGYLLMIGAAPSFTARAIEMLKEANSGGPWRNDWERAHAAALTAWVRHDMTRARLILEEIVEQWPNDMVALRMVHYFHFYEGTAQPMLASINANRDAYQAGTRFAGFVSGMHAFALEENGHYEAAEQAALQALTTNPADAWAIHAQAHVLQSSHQPEAGLKWIASKRDVLADINGFRFHLYWHQALYELALGNTEAALAIYDEEISTPIQEDLYLDMCNSSSLLYLLSKSGVDVGNRWEPLAQIASRHLNDRELLFASVHYLMPLLATGNKNAAKLQSTLRDWANCTSSQGVIAGELQAPIADLLRKNLASGEKVPEALKHDHALEWASLSQIGGSNTQRAIFQIMVGGSSPYLPLLETA